MTVGSQPRISDLNSSSAILANGETWTGTWEPVYYFPSVGVAVKTDQSGVLQMQFSPDGINQDSTLSYDVAADSNDVHRLTVTRGFYRASFTNDSGLDQTYFRLQSLYGAMTALTSTFNSTIQGDADTTVVRAIPAELDIARGKFQGISIVNKFGRNTDIGSATVPEDVWDGGGVYTGFPAGAAELVTLVSSSTDDTASAGSGARTCQIFGLDASGNEQTETINLNGQTKVDSANTYTRVNRVLVLTAGSATAFNAGTLTCQHKTTTANIFAVVPIGVNQSQVAAFTIPAGKTGYINQITVSVKRSNNAVIDYALWVRNSGAAPRLIRIGSDSQTSSAIDRIFGGIPLPALTDVTSRVTSSSANGVEVTAAFDLILVDA